MPSSTTSSDRPSAPCGPWTWASRGAGCLAFAALLVLGDRAIDLVLSRGLQQYYGLDRDAEVVCVGHSRTMMGIDGPALERSLGVPVAKYAVNGASLPDRVAMIRHFVALHPRSVRAIVYDVDAFVFSDAGLSSNSYRLFMPFISDPVMLQHVLESGCSARDLAVSRLAASARYDDVTLWLSLRGLFAYSDNASSSSIDVGRLAARLRSGEVRRIAFDPRSAERFDEMVRYVVGRGITLVLVYIPTIDLLNESAPEAHARVIRRLAALPGEQPGVRFLDYNLDLQHRHELFFDEIHMNRAGQTVVTDRLAVDLRRILNPAGKTADRGSGGRPSLSGKAMGPS